MRILLVVVAFLVGMLWGKSSSAVEYNLISEKDTPEIYCLAQNILFEASTEPVAGKIAVGLVVLNRVKDTRYPNTICEVVKQGPIYESWKTRNNPDLKPDERVYFPVKHRCQFSWYCDGKKDIIWATYMNGDVIQENMTAWRDSIHVALFMMSGNMKNDITHGAVFYYNPHIANPAWGAIYNETVIIGNHRFMKD